MTSVKIYEPAMCCSTGLCGTSVDPELLRISTVLETLDKLGCKVERFNLSNAPEAFVKSVVVTTLIRERGPEALPAVTLNGAVVMSGRYPTNDELTGWFSLPAGTLSEKKGQGVNGGCCCKGGRC